VVVRAHARPIRPVQHAVVSVRIGDFRHEADVFGDRVTELVQGRLRFSEPMPFEAMPLRYELAYGGRDPVYEAAVMQEVVRTTDPADLRRGGPVLESMFAKNNPLMYARNRVGRGWVLECGPEVAEGRALPNIERRDDRLTPERLIVRNPLNWIHQPIPVGFDYLDPLAYPRSAMIGISQDAQRTARPPEVERGLIPADFWRGNITDGPGSKVPDRIHPDASRVASLGLRMPFLAGGSAIGLEGMDAREPRFIVWLPRERPWFEVPATLVQDGHVRADLHLVHIDVDARVLSLVWAGRARLSGLVLPGTEAQVESEVRTHISEY
jgi:hypothetical protein